MPSSRHSCSRSQASWTSGSWLSFVCHGSDWLGPTRWGCARRLVQPASGSGRSRFEKLKGDRAGCYSIRINDQWRITFRIVNNRALDVTIEDEH